MNLFTLLAQAARRFPEHGAVYRGTERLHSYRELHARAAALGAGLRRRWPVGERVAIASENRPEVVELLFGIWAAGQVAVPVNAKLHPREVADILRNAGARCVFASPALADAIEAALPGGAAAPELLRLGSAQYEELLSAPPAPSAPFEPVAADALAWLFYTSGTTGRSKGAMLSHRNLMAMTVAQLADIESIQEHHSQIHAAPMSHGSGLYIPAYVARGARQVVPASGGFDPQEFIELCSAHPGCGAFLAPTMVQRLRVEAERSGQRPTQLRSIVYGGGPMYVQEIRRSLQAFGPVFAQIYGQGESPMTITALRRHEHETDDDRVLGSVGWARTGCEVRVVDAAGEALPAGQVGEIVCRGDTVMQGYWNDEAATRDALRGGWLFTGDVGALDESGLLTLHDRSKDLIISGGSNIYPREVEEVLLKHPAVQEVCVVGQPDEEWGESVVAFVVPVPGATLDAAELDALCLAHIARFKRPKLYRFVEALAKNSYGKVLKREMRKLLEGPAAA